MPPPGIDSEYVNWMLSPETTLIAENVRWSHIVPPCAAWLNKPHSVIASDETYAIVPTLVTIAGVVLPVPEALCVWVFVPVARVVGPACVCSAVSVCAGVVVPVPES